MPKRFKIPVLYFHSVAPYKHPDWCNSFLTLELKYFEAVVRKLSRSGYKFILLDDYIRLRKDDSAASHRKYVCLTFDDGYLDNYVFVFPILKKYQARGTIFVNPSNVQRETITRSTLDDLSKNRKGLKELDFLGYCNWAELAVMDRSGFIDIQSHALSHTKICAGTKIREFHHPEAKWLYPIANLYPDRAPYYATDKNFRQLIPYGTPFFEEKSSLIARQVTINPAFSAEAAQLLNLIDWGKYSFKTCWEKVAPLYESYRSKDELIVKVESELEYQQRIHREISESKRILDTRLGKSVRHICWPHGDYTTECHDLALDAGFVSSLMVRRDGKENHETDRFDRIGVGALGSSVFLTKARLIIKLSAYRDVFPNKCLASFYRKSKHA